MSEIVKPAIEIVPESDLKGSNEWLRTELHALNVRFMGEYKSEPFSVMAKVGDVPVGGVAGSVHLGWLSIDITYIEEKYRGQGLGRQLMEAIEEEGRRRGATRAYVETASFQAEGFYAKFGYAVYGRFSDFAPGVDRIFMRKDQL